MLAKVQADYDAKVAEAKARVEEDIGGAFDEELDPEGRGFFEVDKFATVFTGLKQEQELVDYMGPDVDIDDVNSVFGFFDTDKDGKITRDELLKPFFALAEKKVEAENAEKVQTIRELEIDDDSEGIPEFMREYDIGEKGYLTKDDMKKWHDKSKDDLAEHFYELMNVEDFEAFFSFLDRNGNGQIEREELELFSLRADCIEAGVMPPPL